MTRSILAAALASAIGLGLGLACGADAYGESARALPAAKAAIHHHRGSRPAAAKARVLKLAGCYGRFIAWRDELSSLMLQSSSYTPWPTDKIRFDAVEHGFADGARRDLKLVLKLEPAFREVDLPPDIRAAFRAGLKTSTAAFAVPRYRDTQTMVLGQPDLSPRQRMAQLEANADEAFAPVAAPCEAAPAR